MGNVNLPPIDSKGHRTSEEYLRYIAESLAMLQDELQNILEGRISAENIKANTITANKMNVTELSAISANLGHILAGLIESVTIIGSLIQTSASSYPRAEMRSDDYMFKAAATIDRVIEIVASFLSYPIFRLSDETGTATVSYQPDPISSIPSLRISSDSEINFLSNGNIKLLTGLYSVLFTSWNTIKNNATSQTLQQALDAKQNVISGYTGSFVAGTNTVTVVNGIITNVV